MRDFERIFSPAPRTPIRHYHLPPVSVLWGVLWRSIVTGFLGGALLGMVVGAAFMLFLGTLQYIEDGMPWHNLQFHLFVAGLTFVAAMIGSFTGFFLGIPFGLMNGVLLALLTRLFFYPLRDEGGYLWGMRVLGAATSAVGALFVLAGLDPGRSLDNWPFAALALIVTLFGGWASRYPAQWYIDQSSWLDYAPTVGASAGRGA